MGSKLLFLAICILFPAIALAADQPTSYVVKAGDDLPDVADNLRPRDATAAQMGVAIVQANRKVIWANYDREKRRLRPGTQLIIPPDSTVTKMDAATAEREFSRMWRAEQHYRAALALEGSRDRFYAFNSYVEAAKLGHGLAQYRLGQMYDRDFSGFLSHDLMESAKWYEKARKSEVQVRGQKALDPGSPSVIH